MNIIETEIKGVLVIEPDVFYDDRGFFLESYNQDRFQELGIQSNFVQDNLSLSKYGTLRGLHYQHPHEQAKLVQVIQGAVFDITVDIRTESPTFGKWIGIELSAENKKQMLIPEGFAHGYCVLRDTAVFQYKCSDFYVPDCEGGILWSDPDLAIDWPVNSPIVSDKDSKLPFLRDIPKDRLPFYKY